MLYLRSNSFLHVFYHALTEGRSDHNWPMSFNRPLKISKSKWKTLFKKTRSISSFFLVISFLPQKRQFEPFDTYSAFLLMFNWCCFLYFKKVGKRYRIGIDSYEFIEIDLSKTVCIHFLEGGCENSQLEKNLWGHEMVFNLIFGRVD